jgi:hypothetical protein
MAPKGPLYIKLGRMEREELQVVDECIYIYYLLGHSLRNTKTKLEHNITVFHYNTVDEMT